MKFTRAGIFTGAAVAVRLLLTAGSIVSLKAGRKPEPEPFTGLKRKHSGHVERFGNGFLEATVEKGGRLRVSFLERDETTLVPIPAAELKGQVQRWSLDAGAQDLLLTADPQPGEPAGSSSTFVGDLPPELLAEPMNVALTVPADGKAQRLAFNVQAHLDDHDGGMEMPAKVSAAKEKQLYLTPGGRYKEADIEANGRMVASQKFRGFQPNHDVNPPRGSLVCPITNTKANPRITWVIGGKTYQFCCPPCVDEFVKQAKEKPASIKPPDRYVKQ